MLQHILALYDLIAFLDEDKKEPEPELEEPQTAEPYRYYTFKCHLCSGETKFRCVPSEGKKYYRVECRRCGLENRVSIEV